MFINKFFQLFIALKKLLSITKYRKPSVPQPRALYTELPVREATQMQNNICDSRAWCCDFPFRVKVNIMLQFLQDSVGPWLWPWHDHPLHPLSWSSGVLLDSKLQPTRLLHPWGSQARILEWVAISFSRGSSQPRDRTRVSCVSCTGRQILYHWATWDACRNPSKLPHFFNSPLLEDDR